MRTGRPVTPAGACVYRKSPDILARSVAGEPLLIPIRGNLADLQRIFALDAVGKFVWERIDGTRTAGVLAKAVADEFEVSVETAARDLGEFLNALASAGLVLPAADEGT